MFVLPWRGGVSLFSQIDLKLMHPLLQPLCCFGLADDPTCIRENQMVGVVLLEPQASLRD